MKSRLAISLLVLPVLTWAALGSFGNHLSLSIASRYGQRILASADGKFNDPQFFVANRLNDAAIIITAACLLLLAYWALATWFRLRLAKPASWVAEAWVAFVLLNIFVAVTAHTVLFWCALYTGKVNIQNYTQWRVKAALLREAQAPSRVVLLGSSQTRSQIDSKILNAHFAGKLWTTELHFPGSSVYDTLLSLERLPNVRVAYVITYLSEGNFYEKYDNARLMYFFGLSSLPSYWSLGAGRPDFDGYIVSGLLGDICPMYQIWEPVVARARIWETHNVAQEQYDAALGNDLTSRAQRAAGGMHLGPLAQFQKRAFAALAQACNQRGARLIVCCGQFNPILSRALDPALRPDMMSFLRQQARQDTNIVLFASEQLPLQSESDYEDLAHVNLATRTRFSQYLAHELDALPPNSPLAVK